MAPSYQTAPLTQYNPALQHTATDLFDRVAARVGSKAKQYKGSFSVFASSRAETAAKIVIYESGKGKPNGEWPDLPDGVYVLIRTSRNAGRRARPYPTLTLGIAPKHNERFAFFRLAVGQDMNQIADFIAAFAGG